MAIHHTVCLDFKEIAGAGALTMMIEYKSSYYILIAVELYL